MYFKFDSIEMEIDVDDFKDASDRIATAASLKGQGTLDAMLVLLLIRFVDAKNPGSGQMILESLEEAAR